MSLRRLAFLSTLDRIQRFRARGVLFRDIYRRLSPVVRLTNESCSSFWMRPTPTPKRETEHEHSESDLRVHSVLALSTAVAATTIGAGQPPLNDTKTVDCKKEILVVNPDGQPISGANVTTSFEQNELETLTTDANGIATASKCGAGGLMFRAEAVKYRPAYGAVGIERKSGRIILLPETQGITVDEQGRSIPHVNLVFDESRTLVFNEDGKPELPNGTIYRSGFDQSNAAGEFRLMSRPSSRP